MRGADVTNCTANRNTTRGDDKLIFIHLPKTGGMTLRNILYLQYAKESIFEIWGNQANGLSAFFSLSNEEKANLSCLLGHMSFGFHEYLPGQSRYITILRHPVGRLISEYRHMARTPNQPRTWQVPGPHLKSLEDYLAYRVESHSLNIQTRLIGGYVDIDSPNLPFDPLPEDALERAKQNLRNKFIVVGVTERFEESILLMKMELGWRGSILSRRRNTSALPSGSSAGVSPETRERIAKVSEPDMELYQLACELQAEKVQAQDENFQSELKRFQNANRRIYALQAGYWKIFPGKLRRLIKRIVKM